MSTGENNAPSSDQSAAEPVPEPSVSEDSSTSAESTSPAKPDPPKVSRGAGPLAARGLGIAKPASQLVSQEQLAAVEKKAQKKKKQSAPRPRLDGEGTVGETSGPG